MNVNLSLDRTTLSRLDGFAASTSITRSDAVRLAVIELVRDFDANPDQVRQDIREIHRLRRRGRPSL